MTVEMKTVCDSALRLLGEIVSRCLRIFLLYCRSRRHFVSKHVQFAQSKGHTVSRSSLPVGKDSITGLYNECLWHWISIISEMKVYDFSWCSSANRAQSTSAALQPALTHANTDDRADEEKSGPEKNDVLNHGFCSAVLKILSDTATGGMMSFSSSLIKLMSSPKQVWRGPEGSVWK